MKLIFLGTPDFAVDALQSIIASKHEVAAVVTQPDKPGNRNKLSVPPVKEAALKHGIKVLQYDKISKQGVEDIIALAPDIMVTAAYGQILSREILAIPRYGVINIHASLLPKYRGSSPIQWAIVNGEEYSGVTIMQTEYEVDSGAIIDSERVAIGEEMTAGDLFIKLSEVGAKLIVKVLDDIENGSASYIAQNDAEATYCKMLTKADGKVDFNKSYRAISCWVRGMTPWPSAHCIIGGIKFKIHKIARYACASDVESVAIGSVAVADVKKGLIIRCADAFVKIEELQAEGGKRMSASDYLKGHELTIGAQVE